MSSDCGNAPLEKRGASKRLPEAEAQAPDGFFTGDRQRRSLYHFTVGGGVADTRLTTLPPYGHLPMNRALELLGRHQGMFAQDAAVIVSAVDPSTQPVDPSFVAEALRRSARHHNVDDKAPEATH